MGVVGGWAVIDWCLRTFPLRVLADFSAADTPIRACFWFWQRNVTYAVQLEAERGRGPI